MHTAEISKATQDATQRLLDSTIAPESAKAISDLCRTEISNWRARMEYARHNGSVVTIAQLEAVVAGRKAA